MRNHTLTPLLAICAVIGVAAIGCGDSEEESTKQPPSAPTPTGKDQNPKKAAAKRQARPRHTGSRKNAPRRKPSRRPIESRPRHDGGGDSRTDRTMSGRKVRAPAERPDREKVRRRPTQPRELSDAQKD